MRTLRRLSLLAVLGATAACTALLGDFAVDADDAAGDSGAAPETGGADGTTTQDAATDGGVDTGTDAPVDAPLDVAADAPPDGAPPIPDGGFLRLYSFGSTNTSPPGNMRVAYDPGGNLFILFGYSGYTANPDVLGEAMPTPAGFDMGLVKIAPNGQKVWVKPFSSAGGEYPGGLAVDGNGDVYISGASENVTSFDLRDAGTLTKPSAVRYMGWVLKVNGVTGEPIKAINIETNVPANNQGAICSSLAARGNRVVALCSVYGDTRFPLSDGGVQTVTPPGAAGVSAVIFSLDQNLNTQWANAIGSDANDFGDNVVIAPNNDVLFTMNVTPTSATTLVDSKGSLSVSLGASAPTAIVARLGGAQGLGLWVKAFGGDASNNVRFSGLGIDAMDRVVTVGSAKGSVVLGTKDAGTSGNSDILVATFAGDFGTPLDAKTYGGPGFDDGEAVAVDKWDNVAVSGRYGSANMTIGNKTLPDPFGTTTSGFMYRAAPDLSLHWAGGFTTALAGTFVQSWSVAVDPGSGRVAAAGVYKGLVNFGDSNPVRSIFDGGGYNVWVVERRP